MWKDSGGSPARPRPLGDVGTVGCSSAATQTLQRGPERGFSVLSDPEPDALADLLAALGGCPACGVLTLAPRTGASRAQALRWLRGSCRQPRASCCCCRSNGCARGGFRSALLAAIDLDSPTAFLLGNLIIV